MSEKHKVTKEALFEYLSTYESIDFQHAWDNLEGLHPELDKLYQTAKECDERFGAVLDELVEELEVELEGEDYCLEVMNPWNIQ